MLVRLEEDDGLHIPLRLAGERTIAVEFAPERPLSVATGAAAAALTETLGGTLTEPLVRVHVDFGLYRPARWLALGHPVLIGPFQLTRIGDFLGQQDLPPVERPDAEEVVVEAREPRQQAVYPLVLGRDVRGPPVLPSTRKRSVHSR